MEYRVLGKTGLKISPMGLGGIPLQRIDAQSTKPLIRRMLESGINYIDTARGYSVSEEYLGQALEGVRQHFILATKSMSRTKETMAQDIRTSMKNLRTDYIDLYQVHNPSEENLKTVVAPGGALEALQEAKEAGIIGHIGITLHSLDLFHKALELPWVETIMFPYNIVETQGEELIRRCREKDIGFICMKPLAGGAIDDARLALRFIATNEAVSVVIPGMANLNELEQNLAAINDHSPLSPQELEKIGQLRKELGGHFCRRCNYCAPCSVGMSIPGVFLMHGYLTRYGLQDWAKMRYDGMEKTASDCIECGECESRCPYQLPIREMLKTVAKDFGK